MTHGRIICDIKPYIFETHRTRLTGEDSLIDYPSEITTPTAYIIAAKTLINSIFSTPYARFLCADIVRFYLSTPMEH